MYCDINHCIDVMMSWPPNAIRITIPLWAETGLELKILKIESLSHMGCTRNTVIKDFLKQMCVPLENSAYFGDGDSFNSNPGDTVGQ